MSEPHQSISPERQAAYYIGMFISGIGVLLIISFFFSGFHSSPSRSASSGDPRAFEHSQIQQFETEWQQTQQRHQQFENRISSAGQQAIVGMVLIVVGILIMSVGAKGAAGSGLVLDPEQARKDLEPWNRMKGGMVDDTISEIGVIKKVENAIDRLQPSEEAQKPQVEIKVRCHKCQALNEETAKFCSQCGAAM